ncbi:MAG: cell division protein FtsQ/DivIB [Planctomycetota bacterium]|jgi:cell division septal protein FtsQ
MAAARKVREDSPGRKESSFAFFSGKFWTHTLLRILIGALVAAGGWLAFEMARDRAVSISDFQISPANLEFISKPDWLKGPIEQQLRNCGWSGEKISLLDSDAAKKIAALLLTNPMVKRVEAVERDFPDRVRAKVELREPAAFVLRGSKYHVVDPDGTLLPGEFATKAASGLDLLLIAYVKTTPPPAGKVWEDPAVVEGAQLAAFLKGYEDLVKTARITAIDSSNIFGRRNPRESEIVLLTSDHTKIYWGRGIACANLTELPATEKMDNLEKVMEQTGGLSDKEYLDLRFPNPVYRNRSYYISSR